MQLQENLKVVKFNILREKKILLIYKSEKIGYYRPDFIVEDKIVVEIKKGQAFTKKDFNQIKAYLTKSKYKLGILILFTKTKIRFERILNSL